VYVAQVKGAFYQLFPWPWYYSRGPLWHWRISEVRWHIDANRFLAPAAKISARGRRSAGDIHLNHSERPGVWSRQPRSNFSASRLQPWTVRRAPVGETKSARGGVTLIGPPTAPNAPRLAGGGVS